MTVMNTGMKVQHEDWHITFVLSSSLCFLVLLYYFGRFPFYYEHVAPRLPTTWDIELAGHLYLAAVSVITRTLFPLLCIIFVLRKKPPANEQTFQPCLGRCCR